MRFPRRDFVADADKHQRNLQALEDHLAMGRGRELLSVAQQGFEQTPDFSLPPGYEGVSNADVRTDALARTGNKVLEINSTVEGLPAAFLLHLNTGPGLYSASGWTFGQLPGWDPCDWVRLAMFANPGNLTLADTGNIGAPDFWRQLVVSGTAPPGTTEVNIEGFASRDAGWPSTAFWDDMSVYGGNPDPFVFPIQGGFEADDLKHRTNLRVIEDAINYGIDGTFREVASDFSVDLDAHLANQKALEDFFNQG